MADTLEGVVDLATWPAFRRKVQAAMVKAAAAVGAEQTDENNPDRSRLRRALSVNVLQSIDDYTGRFALAVATNPVITYTSSDSDLEFTVNSVWDTIAGAPPVVGS